MSIQRRPSAPLCTASGLVTLLLLATGCSTSPSPSTTAIERGDATASASEQRVAPMASRRRGLLVAGDGFGRMAYSSPPTVATASADRD